jgi:hypothetical protein
MYLRNRIKRIEQSNQLNRPDKGCECFMKALMAPINRIYKVDDDGNALDQTEYPTPNIEDEFCGICNKLISAETRSWWKKLVHDINFLYGDELDLNPPILVNKPTYLDHNYTKTREVRKQTAF